MERIERFKTDLQKPIRLQELKTDLFLNDEAANTFEVEVTNGGEAVTLTGDVKGYMIRPDGVTVTIDGTSSGNVASVTLPENAYYYTGRANIVIKAEAEDNRVTLAAFTAIVYRDQSDSLVDNDRVIPSLSEIMEIVSQIDDMTLAVTTLPAGSNATGALTTVNNHYHIALGIPRGRSGAEPDVQYKTLTAAGWSGTEDRYNMVSVTGISDDSHILVGLNEYATDQQYVQASLARIHATSVVDGYMNFKAEGVVPTVDLDIVIINFSESGASLVDYTEEEIDEILDEVFG